MRILTLALGVLLLTSCIWANPIVQDLSFENPTLVPYSYQYRPTGTAWTYSGSSGVTTGWSAFDLVTGIPDGNQAAFIQSTTGNISQTITGLTVGQGYAFTFDGAQRPQGQGFGGGEDFNVLWNGVSLGIFNPASTTFSSYLTAGFLANATSGVLTFQAIDSLGGDRTAFIDLVQIGQVQNVELAPVPEPRNALLMLGGLLLFGIGLRKRLYS